MLAGKLSCYFWCKEFNLPQLSLVTNAVVSLITAQLAITEAVGPGHGERGRENTMGTVCEHGAHVHRCVQGGKRGGAVTEAGLHSGRR